MWLIADSGGIEQSDGSFLHQRTHTPNPIAASRPTVDFYGALKVKPLVICFPYVSYLL
jgi:hypothetical protein